MCVLVSVFTEVIRVNYPNGCCVCVFFCMLHIATKCAFNLQSKDILTGPL